MRKCVVVFIGVALSIVLMPGLPVAQVALELRDRIDGYEEEFGRIGAIVADHDGRIYVADVLSQEVVVIDGGVRRRSLGRSGSGPGEYMGLSSLAWAGAVLVTLDHRQRRLTLWDSQGRLLRTVPLNRSILAGSRLFSAGDVAYLQLVTRERLLPGAENPPPDVAYFRVTPAGDVQPVRTIADVAVWPPTTDCMWPNRQRIEILATPYADWQPIRAFTPTGEFVRADRDAFQLDVVHTGSGSVDRSMRWSGQAPPLSLQAWRALPEVIELARVEREAGGTLRRPGNPSEPCPVSASRPLQRPAIRALAVDDLGRTWAEMPSEHGFTLVVFDSTSRVMGEVRMPERDHTVAFFPRGDLLYLATVDDLGVQSIEVYELR